MSSPDHSPSEITLLLREWSSGDPSALEQLVPLIYADLHRMAEHQLHDEASGHTLQPTELINSVFVRLLGQHTQDWLSRAHFFGVASKLMREVLVDHARRKGTVKRGAGFGRVDFSNLENATAHFSLELIVAVDEALTRLAGADKQLAQVVELRFFGGLSVDETATVLRVSSATVKRDWALAKAWLLRRMTEE